MLVVTGHPAHGQDAPTITIVNEDFTEDVGVFRLSRASEEDLLFADGTMSLIGQADETVRSMEASFGGPLDGRVTIATRQRADEGAYGGLYIYGGGRNVIQIGIGQGRGREGLMVEIDNHDREIRQVFYPDIGTKQQWRDYLVEVEGERVVVTVDGVEVVSTTYSGRPLDRLAIWSGMHSLGAMQVDSLRVTWVPEQMAEPVQAFSDDFADETSLQRWSSAAEMPEPAIAEVEQADNDRALHIDFRRMRSWSYVADTPVLLAPNTQYEVTMRVRGVGGTMGARLSVHQLGAGGLLARIDTRATNGFADRSATFVTGPEPGLARLAISDAGRGELWVDAVGLAVADPPRDPHETGVNVLHKTIGTPGNRVGLMIEAESAADQRMVTEVDADGDGLWTAVRFEMPERVVSDVAVNPWQFSNNTVLKSDSAPGGEPLVLRFPSVVPGRYRAYLSAPRRPLALQQAGEWVRVEGGGEYDLGVVEVDEQFEVVVAHRFVDELNPGPVYLDYVRFLPLHDEEQIAAEARAVHEARLSAQSAGWERAEASFAPVSLRIAERAGIARVNEHVVTGVPFAAGELFAGARLLLTGEGGDTVEFSAEPLAYWPDGSVKWLRLRFRTDLPARGATEVRLSADAAGEAISRPLEEVSLGAGGTIETSALRVHLGSGLLELVAVDPGGEDRVMLAGPTLARLSFDGQEAVPAEVVIADYRLVESNLIGTMVEFEGALQWEGPSIGVQGRLLVEESRPVVSLDAWLVHRDGSRQLNLHEAELVLGSAPPTDSVTFGVGGGEAVTMEAANSGAVVQTGEGYDVASFEGEAAVFDGSGAARWSGETVPGWMLLSSLGGGVAAGVREMTERYPKSLSARPAGDGVEVVFGIWPRDAGEPFVWNQGSAISHQVALAFGDEGTGAEDARTMLAATMHPLRAIADAEHYSASGAFGTLALPAERPLWPEFEAEIGRAFDLIVSRRSAWGMEDFGGVFQPGGYVPGTRRMWTNMEYDFSHAVLSQFARVAEPEMLERVDQATRHFTPVDIIHWSPTERFIGGSRTHSHTMEEGHQVGGANFGHGGWPQGPLQVYYLIGERQGLDAGRLLAGYIARNAGPRPDDTSGRPMYGLREERDAGNAILTTITAYEALGDPELLEVAYRVLDYIERCQNPDLGNWDTPITEDPPHRGTTFMLHQLVKGLDAMHEVTGEARVERLLGNLSTWLLTESSDEQYRYGHKYSPRYWRGRNVRNFPRYALAFERAARFSEPEVAEALREKAIASMDALFGRSDGEEPNTLFEVDTGDSSAHRAAQVYAGEPGPFHDYALTVRGREVTFERGDQTVHTMQFSGQPAKWLRLWSGTRSIGSIEIDSLSVERLGGGEEAEVLLAFDFEEAEQLEQWRARVPEDTGSRVVVGEGRLMLMDVERALMGAELDLPEELGADYRIRWRQSMPEGLYGGLMVFGPGEFEFDLYSHRPVAILHVGLNQTAGASFSGVFDNPRSFAPNVTYLNALVGWIEGE